MFGNELLIKHANAPIFLQSVTKTILRGTERIDYHQLKIKGKPDRP